MDLILPFKVGDLAESKSLVKGYRGAWFRCKIHDTRVNPKSGHLEYNLEYFDYPGQKKGWLRVFQKNPASSNKKSRASTQIMIRPSFPKWYCVHEVSEQFPNSDITAIVHETWKVGDLVDWKSDGCYWSGTITKLLNKDLVEVLLPAPPIGEGEIYQAKCSDLRPTLEWFLEKGWMVPLSQANGRSWSVARLLPYCKSESDKCSSGDETSSDDEDGDNDSSAVQQSVCRASNTPQQAPGPRIPAPPSATNSASSQICQSSENLKKPSSTSKSPDPSYDAQAVATSSQSAGIRISIEQEPVIKQDDSSLTEEEVDDSLDEYMEKVVTIEGRLKHLLEHTRLARERSAAMLASFHRLT